MFGDKKNETMSINLSIAGCHCKLLQTITTWNTQIPFTQNPIIGTILPHEDTVREEKEGKKET